MTTRDNSQTHTDRLFGQLQTAVDSIPFQRNHVLILLLVGFGMLFDAIEQYNVGYAGPSLMDYWHITNAQVGLLTTMTFAGLTVGSIVAGFSGDLYGRRITYMYNLLLFAIGGFISAFAPNYDFLLVARAIVGIGLGGEMSAALTIVSEITPTRVRGTALGWVNISAGGIGIFIVGALATLILGPLAPVLGGQDVAWRYLLGLLIIPALFIYYFRRYIPETPRYLVKTGQFARVNRVITQLSTGKLRPIKNLVPHTYVTGDEGSRPAGQATRILDLVKPPLLRRSIVLFFLQITTFPAQVTVTSLMPSILVTRGLPKSVSLHFSAFINIGSLIGAIAAAMFAYYIPRRLVLTGGAILAAAFSIAFGMTSQNAGLIIFGLLASLMYMVLNTSVWLYNPEIYPTRVRALATGIGTAVGLGAASIFPVIAGNIIDSEGSGTLFVVIGIMYIVFAIAGLFRPETRHRTLEAANESMT